MSSYSISPKLKSNRVFILQKSELEKRFDPFFYVPDLLELEKKVLAKKPKKLRDYVVSVSSGATPKTTESELYYAEKENGIPFLRVQDLSPTGVLEFDDCKYINHQTHNGMLKRSQVSSGDLLVKITGVGRMAVASVAPEGFIGNINQHVCVIKTGSKEISETLAAFLNSDIGEKLASRRSAGGTRPALDYPALLSIPIIEDKRILEITAEVIEQKQKNEAEAEKLLSSIDDYLLKELGIKLPELPENTLKNRMFIKTFKEISDNRLDSHFHQEKFKQLDIQLSKGKYPLFKIKKKSILITSGATPLSKGDSYTDDASIGIPFVRSGEIKDITFEDCIYIKPDIHNTMLKSSQLKNGDLLIAIVGATIGEVGIYNHIREANINQAIALVRLSDELLPIFTKEFYKSSIGSFILDRAKRPVARANINLDEIGILPIPVPPLDKQKEIANHITDIRQQAQQLKDKTKELLKNASEEIEKILLN